MAYSYKIVKLSAFVIKQVPFLIQVNHLVLLLYMWILEEIALGLIFW